MLPLRFVPYHRLGDEPNVVVDGSPTGSTVLTLSHWPGSPTPVELQDDLSAQIAFRALARPELFAGVAAVSNNHFDQDGLASVFALTQPEQASARREQVIDVARAGDFATFEHRDSARLAFALAAFDDPERSPLPAEAFRGGYAEQCGALYEALLPRFPSMLDDPESVRPLWEAEDAHLEESLRAVAAGVVGLEEHPQADLAVFTVPEGWAERMTSRFSIARREAVHPMALTSSTACMRLLVHHGHEHRLELRYETWVMFRSRPLRARPNLRLLADMLTAADGGARWTADQPGTLTPVLRVADGTTTLDAARIDAAAVAFLVDAEPAWDPFATG